MSKLNCPVCNAHFNEVVKDGILIDICSQCRGVWLDRGELEKLMHSVRREDQNYDAPQQNRMHDQTRSYYKEDPYARHDHGHPNYKNKYRRKSKFESFFDIFD